MSSFSTRSGPRDHGGALTDGDGSSDRTGHLEGVLVAAYAEGRLHGDERSRVEAHLAECRACRTEATEVALFLRERRSRRAWWIGIPAATAAAAAALLLFAAPPGERAQTGERLRPGAGAGREGVPAITVVAPDAQSPVATDSLRFVWRGSGAEVAYRFTITDESGDIVWEQSVSDTIFRLPAEVTLAADRDYLWYVDAALPDGRVATTGVRGLRIR